MGNCLKTQLKANVQNDSLSKLNEIKVSISALSAETLMYVQGIERVVAYGGGYFSLSQGGAHETDATISTSLKGIYLPAGIDFKLGLFSKYNLVTLSGSSLSQYKVVGQYNISDVKYCTNIQYLTIDGVGDIKDFANHSSLKNLCLTNNVTGDIANLATCTSLLTFTCNESNVYGNISSIGSLIELESINTFNTKVTGKIEDFVSAQVFATRTTGRISWVGILKNSSFGSVAPGTAASYYAPYYLNWESSSKIWIEGVLAPDTNKIWCMGYTQQEAETKWPGKTIVRVDA